MLNSLRVVCSARALVRTSRVSAAGPGHSLSTWLCSTDTRAPVKDRGLSYHTNPPHSQRNFCTRQVELNCWKCQQPRGKAPSFFCMSCEAVQPPEEGMSYFEIMACDHTFTVDAQKLQRRYLQLQRALHPDNFCQKSVTEQEFSESQSSLVNKAYTTLLKPLSRGLYMLELQGMRIEEGTDSGADSEFLLELMEINEALDEARTPEEANKIGQDTKGKLADLTERIDAALRKAELQTARALLSQMKYHANIAEKVKEKLREFM
ncbi:iron-sulfur cluster co-chaperone protein HscB isoform X2 [Paralichthys olivaceus]|uniref:iron-sulfur cluster co-chaperone protein HscB isoform X2 n=1 Tax=Paralichthys olivaceus TaxID=8255 RepID=UPI00097DF846|nr:PREDICTED: iron-sulfur cluster co-chaperone protein HscB, mitochondrial isoform X2 [Paralichthys olivaceus]